MTRSRRGIQSIEVGGTLLQALVDAGAPLPLRELAQRAAHLIAREQKDRADIAQAAARRPKTELDALFADVRARGMTRAVGEPPDSGKGART